MNRVGSVASLTLARFIIQYFLINEGISVTSDILLIFIFVYLLSCLFNDFSLKCLLGSTDMHELDHISFL